MIDTIKALITYLTAAILVLGGVVSIVYLGQDHDPAQADTKTIIAGFVGVALTFLFTQEVQTRTARQAAAATAASTAAANGNGGHA